MVRAIYLESYAGREHQLKSRLSDAIALKALRVAGIEDRELCAIETHQPVEMLVQSLILLFN